MPPGVTGVVIGARVFARKGTEKDERAQAIEDAEKELLMLNKRDEVKIISEAYYNKMRELPVGKTPRRASSTTRARSCCRRARRSRSRCSTRPRTATGTRSSSTSGDGKIEAARAARGQAREDVFNIEAQYSEKIAKLTKGDELPRPA